MVALVFCLISGEATLLWLGLAQAGYLLLFCRPSLNHAFDFVERVGHDGQMVH